MICGFFKSGKWHHPIIEGEVKAISRWGRQFYGELLDDDGSVLTICINGNVVRYDRSILLWFGTRYTGDGTSDNLPAMPVGFKYPAAYPQTPDLCDSPVHGYVPGQPVCKIKETAS